MAIEVTHTFGGNQTYMNNFFVHSDDIASTPRTSLEVGNSQIFDNGHMDPRNVSKIMTTERDDDAMTSSTRLITHDSWNIEESYVPIDGHLNKTMQQSLNSYEANDDKQITSVNIEDKGFSTMPSIEPNFQALAQNLNDSSHMSPAPTIPSPVKGPKNERVTQQTRRSISATNPHSDDSIKMIPIISNNSTIHSSSESSFFSFSSSHSKGSKVKNTPSKAASNDVYKSPHHSRNPTKSLLVGKAVRVPSKDSRIPFKFSNQAKSSNTHKLRNDHNKSAVDIHTNKSLSYMNGKYSTEYASSPIKSARSSQSQTRTASSDRHRKVISRHADSNSSSTETNDQGPHRSPLNRQGMASIPVKTVLVQDQVIQTDESPISMNNASVGVQVDGVDVISNNKSFQNIEYRIADDNLNGLIGVDDITANQQNTPSQHLLQRRQGDITLTEFGSDRDLSDKEFESRLRQDADLNGGNTDVPIRDDSYLTLTGRNTTKKDIEPVIHKLVEAVDIIGKAMEKIVRKEEKDEIYQSKQHDSEAEKVEDEFDSFTNSDEKTYKRTKEKYDKKWKEGDYDTKYTHIEESYEKLGKLSATQTEEDVEPIEIHDKKFNESNSHGDKTKSDQWYQKLDDMEVKPSSSYTGETSDRKNKIGKKGTEQLPQKTADKHPTGKNRDEYTIDKVVRKYMKKQADQLISYFEGDNKNETFPLINQEMIEVTKKLQERYYQKHKLLSLYRQRLEDEEDHRNTINNLRRKANALKQGDMNALDFDSNS